MEESRVTPEQQRPAPRFKVSDKVVCIVAPNVDFIDRFSVLIEMNRVYVVREVCMRESVSGALAGFGFGVALVGIQGKVESFGEWLWGEGHFALLSFVQAQNRRARENGSDTRKITFENGSSIEIVRGYETPPPASDPAPEPDWEAEGEDWKRD